MAFNKTKTIESALKSLNQGKLVQAITEYQLVLRYDPKDQVTLMTLGDLFVRQGDARQATEYFERLAQVYLHEGFNSKAIAIYKKIAKLTPSETKPLERLAELYVQQGVLSEARPIFLQLAEIYLKATQAPKAVDVLRRLLEVEPDNARVQIRLAELYLAIGQRKEAALTYLNFAQRLFDRGDLLETQKLVDKALEVDPGSSAATVLKAQALAASGKPEQGWPLLEALADARVGGETTALLIEMSLQAGKSSLAVELARTVFAKDPKHYALPYKVACALLESGDPTTAMSLLGEIRDSMIDAGEHDRLGQSLGTVAERLPKQLEPREWLVDLYRRTSDPFRLPDAILKLADAAAEAGQLDRAEGLFEEVLEREPENEKVLRRLNKLLEKQGRAPRLSAEPPPAPTDSLSLRKPAEAPSAPPESRLDDDTQRYLNQALTDVDLFASYGLSQKAIHLLENVLQRVPGNTPTLERLLDLYLGAGNERRTAELANQLEHIHRQRGDVSNSERFAELRRRFQKAAGLSEEDLAASAQPVPPAEFSIPAAEPEPDEITLEESEPAPEIAASLSATPSTQTPPHEEAVRTPAEQEVDLSDEWMSLSEDVQTAPDARSAVLKDEPAAEVPAEPPSPESAPHSHEAPAAGAPEFELELVPPEPAAGQEHASATTEDFLDDLATEFSDLEVPPAPTDVPTIVPPASKPAPVHAEAPPPPPAQPAAPPVSAPVSSAPADEVDESLDGLHKVFQEFRDELGELGEEDEDLETHYNLGIAYREMGLFEEAIGEFQKVAKSVQNGRAFRYAMQCSTLLGLTFMAKGEPKIAAMWYLRALETPGLDQESILALRYDLGVSQELAGDSSAALDSFQKVYAINIDYRDVAERIVALQKR
jgi:tetratricopeptide (TPR) repeat protein